jgi:hypothetical protein
MNCLTLIAAEYFGVLRLFSFLRILLGLLVEDKTGKVSLILNKKV